jgi:hypothetical protein
MKEAANCGGHLRFGLRLDAELPAAFNMYRAGIGESRGQSMTLRKIVATITVAALFFWTPSLIPVRVAPAPVRVASIAPCGFIPIASRTADTAEAAPVLSTPCPIGAGPSPWPVIVVGAGVVSVILNGIIVAQTQCRELTLNEAWASFLLPFLGMAFNQVHNLCHPPRHH